MGHGPELGFWQAWIGRARLLAGLLLWASPATLKAGDFAYSTASGGVTVTRYTGHGSSVVIPSTLNRRPVIAIGAGAFSSCTNLTTTAGGNPLALDLAHDTRGRLTGTAMLQINTGKARVPLSLSAKGSATGTGGTLLVTLTLKGRDPARNVSASLSFRLTLRANERRLSGPVTGSIEVNGVPAPIAETATLDLPPSVDGTWSLRLDLWQEAREASGTATLTLSNGVQYLFTVKGRTTGAMVALWQTGQPSDLPATGIRIRTTLETLEGALTELSTFSGNAYGQTLVWFTGRPPATSGPGRRFVRPSP